MCTALVSTILQDSAAVRRVCSLYLWSVMLFLRYLYSLLYAGRGETFGRPCAAVSSEGPLPWNTEINKGTRHAGIFTIIQ